MYRIIVFLFALLCTLSACGVQECDTFGQAPEPVRDEEIQKTRKTEVYKFTFSDTEGNIIIYYLCETTCSQESNMKVSRVDIQALCEIFDAEDHLAEKEIDICGHPGALYLVNGRAFFCCTASAKSTVVLEYPPEVITEETALKILRSIFEPVE